MQATAGSRGDIESAGARHAPAFPAAGSAFFRVYKAIPDLVNGNVADFRFIFVSEGLNAEWRWIPDAVNLVVLPNSDEVHVKRAVLREATIHSITLATAGHAPVRARMEALILATCRQSMRRAWGIQDADIVATQMMVFTANPNLNALNVLAANVAGFATAVEFANELAAMDALFEIHKDGVLAKAAQCAIGMPACNGVTIMASLVHHYVEPHKQICDAVLEQVFPAPLAAPAGISVDDLKDVICHKAAHPILSTLLVWMARTPAVKLRLMAVGLGSAAVRLPAEFGPEKTASAFKALVHRGAAACRSANVAVNTAHVDGLKTRVTQAVEANRDSIGIQNATRLTDAFKTEHGYGLAWLAGFLNAQFQETNAGPLAKSIIEAYSVKTLIGEIHEAYAEGMEHFQLQLKWKKGRAREGQLAGVGLFGADTPEPFGAVQAAEEN